MDGRETAPGKPGAVFASGNYILPGPAQVSTPGQDPKVASGGSLVGHLNHPREKTDDDFIAAARIEAEAIYASVENADLVLA